MNIDSRQLDMIDISVTRIVLEKLNLKKFSDGKRETYNSDPTETCNRP